jgi:hypothetical protein
LIENNTGMGALHNTVSISMALESFVIMKTDSGLKLDRQKKSIIPAEVEIY